jgi:hypothetical protein
MNTARWILRLVFFLLAVLLVVYINKKSDDHAVTVAEFKYNMFKKIESDSLDTKHKLDLLVDETSTFIDDSSRIQKGIHYLTLLFATVVIVEIGFLIFERKYYRRQEDK